MNLPRCDGVHTQYAGSRKASRWMQRSCPRKDASLSGSFRPLGARGLGQPGRRGCQAWNDLHPPDANPTVIISADPESYTYCGCTDVHRVCGRSSGCLGRVPGSRRAQSPWLVSDDMANKVVAQVTFVVYGVASSHVTLPGVSIRFLIIRCLPIDKAPREPLSHYTKYEYCQGPSNRW